MQHLGEISAAQCSRGKGKRDKWQVEPRKEIQKRSFWRRFFSSFLSLDCFLGVILLMNLSYPTFSICNIYR